jgi:hypothetical protein
LKDPGDGPCAEEDGATLPFAVMGLSVRDVHRRVRIFEGDYEHKQNLYYDCVQAFSGEW